MATILWDKSHLRLDFIKEKIQEIREHIKNGTDGFDKYKSARIVNYLTEYDSRVEDNVTYAKIRLGYK